LDEIAEREISERAFSPHSPDEAAIFSAFGAILS
jgi:hypothetical protein